MPNYYAHLRFGRQVYLTVKNPLQYVLEAEWPAFELGCLGPDVLFFCRPFTGGRPQREGLLVHERSALPMFLRLERAIAEGQPMAKGYAAGLLCHLALDSACHPCVNSRAVHGPIPHLAIEAEFDRLLMEGDGRSIRSAHLPPPVGEEVYRAAARAYRYAGSRDIEEGFLTMRRAAALLAGLSGRTLGRLADRLCRMLSPLREAAGVVLGKEPDPACVESNRILLSILENTVPVAAKQTVLFFAAVEAGKGLDRWLDRDFEGTVYRNGAPE